jgi:putrescine transport system permease protein
VAAAVFLIPFLIILKISLAEPVVAQPPFTRCSTGAHRAGTGQGHVRELSFLFQDSYYAIIYVASLKMPPSARCCACCLATRCVLHRRASRPLAAAVLLLAVILPFWISFLLRVYAWIGLLNNRA